MSVVRGEVCVFSTPSHINDDMRPTDHAELLETALYPLALAHGVSHIQAKLELALREACTDARGVFCAHQCFYIELVNERAGTSPFSLDRATLPRHLASCFQHFSSELRSLAFTPSDTVTSRPYKVMLAGIRILARDHGVAWGIELSP